MDERFGIKKEDIGEGEIVVQKPLMPEVFMPKPSADIAKKDEPKPAKSQESAPQHWTQIMEDKEERIERLRREQEERLNSK